MVSKPGFSFLDTQKDLQGLSGSQGLQRLGGPDAGLTRPRPLQEVGSHGSHSPPAIAY